MKTGNYILFILVSLLVTVSSRADIPGEKSATTIRIMTVVIVQQDNFLQYLLGPYLADKNITIEYSQGHHSDVAVAVERGEIDIAITHTKVDEMQDLAANGILLDGRALFANPKAFLGPAGDPANISGLTDATAAMQRILESGFCYVINPHGEMENLQYKLLEPVMTKSSCILEDAMDTADALQMAYQDNAYTLWGLHPYLAKGDAKLEPVVIPDERMLQNLGVWIVKGSRFEAESADLINYLATDTARTRLLNFRFAGDEGIQPWWPAK